MLCSAKNVATLFGIFPEFRRARNARAPMDLVESEVEVFGQRVRVRIDPLDVKRVGRFQVGFRTAKGFCIGPSHTNTH